MSKISAAVEAGKIVTLNDIRADIELDDFGFLALVDEKQIERLVSEYPNIDLYQYWMDAKEEMACLMAEAEAEAEH